MKASQFLCRKGFRIQLSADTTFNQKIINIINDSNKHYKGCFHSLMDWQLDILTNFTISTFDNDVYSLLNLFSTTLLTPVFPSYLSLLSGSSLANSIYFLVFPSICSLVSFSPFIFSLDAPIHIPISTFMT